MEDPTPLVPKQPTPRPRRSYGRTGQPKPSAQASSGPFVEAEAPSIRKTKRQSYRRIRVDENDLWRIAEIVNRLAVDHGGQAKIEIVSADEEDTIRSTNPRVFLRNDIPTEVKSVLVEYDEWKSPITCFVGFGTTYKRDAELKVVGSDPTVVAGLFYELDREIRFHRAWGEWIHTIDDVNAGLWWWFGQAALATLGILLAILNGLLAGSLAARFGYTSASGSVGLAIVVAFVLFIPYILVVFGFVGLLRRALPSVQFSGRLSDAGSKARIRLTLVGTLLVIPFLINVLAALVMLAVTSQAGT
jgi:hypothetical protein